MSYFGFDPETHPRSAWAPIVDVYERGGEFVVRVELPGVRKDDIRLRWRNDVLTVSGVKRPGAAESHGRFLCVERQHGHFRRDIALRAAIDFGRARAELRDGVLEIRLPKGGGGESFIPIEG